MSLELQVQSDLLVIYVAAAWGIISILNISIVPIPLHKNLFFSDEVPFSYGALVVGGTIL